jgi:glycosyltransferase involved in cell wall biosynthesis
MRISIAMATYNGAEHLQRQLDSFVAQTALPNELVVCDDCSSDDTLGVLERFIDTAPFDVQVYRNDINLGFTKNFEKALSKCSGDLIFLSDQDDIWFPEKVASVTQAFMANTDKLLVIHDGRLVNENLVSKGATKFGQVSAAYGSPNSIKMGALTVVRKELLDIALPVPDGMLGHDIWLHNIAALLDMRCVIDNELQLIVRHGLNASDWIGSSVEKINKWDLWKSEFRTSTATNYSDRILINEASLERLSNIIARNNSYSPKVIEESLNYLRKELKALKSRDILARSSWLLQKMMCFRMFFRGDYTYFNGLRSFLRDLAR